MKEFVPYKQALKLKELGFNEPSFLCYSKEGELSNAMTLNKTELNDIGFILAPLYQQAFRWFREKYDLRIWIESNYGVLKFEYVIATTNFNFIDKQFNDLSGYNTYEEAELACLIKLIEIVKTKQL